MRKLFTLLLCCLLSLSIGSIPVQAATVGKIGQPVTEQGYQLTVNQIKTGYTDYIQKPYIALDVTIDSLSDKSAVNANLLYAKLKNENGYVYDPSFSGVEPSLATVNDIPEGERVRGWITFELADFTSTNYTFEYKPTTFSGKGPRLKVDFERPSY